MSIDGRQPVLDEQQLRRIERLHSGFLYQHLFAIACLLSAHSLQIDSVIVERDEDIEIAYSTDVRSYIQVKQRSKPLVLSHISDTLDRFKLIRASHAKEARTSTAEFWVVANVEPADSLAETIAAAEWPSDVFVRTPNTCTGTKTRLPVPADTLAKAVEQCVELAANIPFSALLPETMVWKLAAVILLASTGDASGNNHRIPTAELPQLCEQFMQQLQDFPDSPAAYLPHENEPEFLTSAGIRLITGFSGAGKTAWGTQLSLHSNDKWIYFDTLDLPDSAVPIELARAIVGSTSEPGAGDDNRGAFLPGSTGVQSLRSIDTVLRQRGIVPRIVLDNAHRISAANLNEVVRAMPNARWVLLAQPWPGRALIETTFQIRHEDLGGWSRDTVSKVLYDSECTSSPEVCERVLSITAGLPLFVLDIARLAKAAYGGETSRLCDDLSKSTTADVSGQQAILQEVRYRLSMPGLRCAAVLSLCAVPLLQDEATRLLADALNIVEADAAAGIRDLSGWGVIQRLTNSQMTLHDSFRGIASEVLRQEDPRVLAAGRRALADLLRSTIEGGGVDRFRLFCDLLPWIGETRTLIDIATADSEHFDELGLSDHFSNVLDSAANDSALPPDSRFWAADTVAFWSLQHSDVPKAISLLGLMETLLPQLEDDPLADISVCIKTMMLAAVRNDLAAIASQYSRFETLNAKPSHRRILMYSYGLALFECGRAKESAETALALIADYYDVLGLKLEDILFKNLPDIAPNINGDQLDDVKHLADCLDLRAQSLTALGEPSDYCRIHAHKFYILAHAYSSAVRIGLDYVDECIGLRCDAEGARLFVEGSLIPLVNGMKLLSQIVPVMSQYAVVLAYCGETDRARETMDGIRSYVELSQNAQDQYENQRQLIEQIAIANNRFTVSRQDRPTLGDTKRRKPGRNEKCPCGSGLKYKKCCGR